MWLLFDRKAKARRVAGGQTISVSVGRCAGGAFEVIGRDGASAYGGANVRRVHRVVLLVVLSYVLGGCGSEHRIDPDSGIDPPLSDALAAPFVTTVFPLDGAVDVEGDVVVTAVFSEPMDPATITAATFTMTGPSGIVEGIVTYDSWSWTARFRPAEELTMLESYTVTLAPAVADIDGHSMAEPFQWTFTVGEKWWRAPEAVYTVNGAMSPSIACDSAGNVMAVWQQRGSNGSELYAARRIGSVWATAERLDTGANPVVTVQLASLASGGAIVGWDDQEGVWVRQWQLENGWGEPVCLDTLGSGPSVAINARGDAIATWSGVAEIKAARYTQANGWEIPTSISTEASTGHSPVAIADSGDGLLLWHQTNIGSAYHVWAREYSVAMGWGPAVQLASDYSYPDGLAMSPAGAAMALWTESTHDREPAASSLVARHYLVGGGWSNPTVLHSGLEGHGDARIAMNRAGDAIAVWQHRNPDTVVARRFDATTAVWEEAVILPTVATPEWPQIAIGGDGKAFAAWEERRSSSGDRTIVAAHYRRSGLVASDVEELGSSEAYSVALAACPGGTAIVVWSEDAGLYASEYR